MTIRQHPYLGQFRLGLGVLGYIKPWCKLFINGVDQTSHLGVSGMSITDELNHAPNTADFKIRGLAPTKGQTVQLYMGVQDTAHQLFGGRILSIDQGFEDIPGNLVWDCHCIDPSWLLDRKKVLAKYTNQSATDILIDLITRFVNSPPSPLTAVAPFNILGGLETVGGSYRWVTTFVYSDGSESGRSPESITVGPVVLGSQQTEIDSIPIGGATVVARRIYRRRYDIADTFQMIDTVADNVTTTYFDSATDASIAANPTAPIAVVGSDVTTANVTAGLPVIDEITFINDDVSACISKVMDRIGGYWFMDYAGDLHAFITSTDAPVVITDASPRSASDIRQSIDLSQVATRVWCRGKSASATADVAVGATTIPIADGTEFSASGGYAETGPQRLTYTTKSSLDGQGCVTSGIPGAGPNAPAPAYANIPGNMDEGVFSYVCTFVNALGETSAGGSAPVTIPAVSAPNNLLVPSGTTGGSLTLLGTYYYHVTYGTAAGETETSAVFRGVTLVGSENAISLTNIPISADPRVTKRLIYRRDTAGPGSAVYGLITTINDNVTTTYTDTTADGSRAAPPGVNDAGTGQTTVGIPVGPTGTTARKLYRTAVNGSVFMLQSTTADNTTLSVTDNSTDGSLGSALGGSSVGAAPGDTTLSVTDLAKFPSSGWARAGSQVINYTGRSASTGEGTLTGIPASGAGSILSSIPAGQPVVVEPHLIGIPASGLGSVRYAITQGDAITLVAGAGDAAAQAVMAGLVGGDGVHEHTIGGDYSLAEAMDRATAELTQRKDPLATVHLKSRDITLVSGRILTVALTNPDITGDFQIQRVTITDIGIGGPNGNVAPTRVVEASSKRYSFEDILRRIERAA